VVLLLLDSFLIKSQLGDYSVVWCSENDHSTNSLISNCNAAIIDENVWNLYSHKKKYFKQLKNIIIQPVNEEIKNPYTSISICEKLLNSGFRRNHVLVAIGGGIIQDLTTFCASILFRGVPWIYIPTTLLAQSDSCIGGKSSLNIGSWKNQIGNFYPPNQIYLDTDFLKTLTKDDIRSGMGEIIKVHLVSGKKMAKSILKDLSNEYLDFDKISLLIQRALKLKTTIIETDEFDKGKRLIMNYGHTFGHALESASKFSIPHGIAVTIGIDIANFVSFKLKKIKSDDYQFMSSVIKKNLRPGDLKNLDMGHFFDALNHDKKNTSDEYGFILPYSIGRVKLTHIKKSRKIDSLIEKYLKSWKG